jgi:peptide subunit release factor 1 (eRF1)
MRSTRFTKGNEAEKRRKHRRGGRPTRTQAQLKKLAADMVKKRLEDGMGSIVDTYISLATGMPVGDKSCRLDPATTRHAIDRFVSQAPRSLTLDLHDTVESFFGHVMEEGQKEERGKGDGQEEKGYRG